MRLLIFVLCLLWHSVAFSQIPKSAEVDYYDFDIMTVARIKPKTYDDSYYGRYNHIRINDTDSLTVLNGIISTLCDTISQPHLPDTIKITSKGEKMRIERYPKIDVRGKIFVCLINLKTTYANYFLNRNMMSISLVSQEYSSTLQSYAHRTCSMWQQTDRCNAVRDLGWR